MNQHLVSRRGKVPWNFSVASLRIWVFISSRQQKNRDTFWSGGEYGYRFSPFSFQASIRSKHSSVPMLPIPTRRNAQGQPEYPILNLAPVRHHPSSGFSSESVLSHYVP